MKKISVKDHDLITDIASRASDEFLTFFLKGGIVDLYLDLQTCHKRMPLDLKRLLNSSRDDFSHDIKIISQYFRFNIGTLTPYCLKRKTTMQSASNRES